MISVSINIKPYGSDKTQVVPSYYKSKCSHSLGSIKMSTSNYIKLDSIGWNPYSRDLIQLQTPKTNKKSFVKKKLFWCWEDGSG